MRVDNQSAKVWVLVDNRVGNAHQAIELAEVIGEKFETKKIEYNGFSKLPSYFLGMFPIHVKKSVLLNLKSQTLPEIIISAGRRTAALALHLKKVAKTKGAVKIIQIMRPDIDPREFDLIVLPQHDSFNYTLPNIVRIIGALTNTQAKIQGLQNEFENKYPEIGSFIAVIIGGSTKGYKLTLNNAKLLAQSLSNLSENHSLPLFITFSRRTPENIKVYFKEKFAWPNIIYDPVSGEYNPYPALLGKAEYIISTTDSISMCSEAVSTGKSVYVFCPASFKLKKHNFFIQQLVDLGLVRRLDLQANIMEKYKYEPLAEIAKVAAIIREKILY
ncbi:MAG: mitochondrial fission ELM1 family protein [Rickettsiaceae bacterium]